MNNKKAFFTMEHVIFLVLNLMFLSIMLLFVYNKTNDASVYEKRYVKEIAFLIDQAKPGTTIVMKIDYPKSGKVDANHFIIDQLNHKITVKLTDNAKGFGFYYFNDASIKFEFDPTFKDVLFIKVGENNE